MSKPVQGRKESFFHFDLENLMKREFDKLNNVCNSIEVGIVLGNFGLVY